MYSWAAIGWESVRFLSCCFIILLRDSAPPSHWACLLSNHPMIPPHPEALGWWFIIVAFFRFFKLLLSLWYAKSWFIQIPMTRKAHTFLAVTLWKVLSVVCYRVLQKLINCLKKSEIRMITSFAMCPKNVSLTKIEI